MEVLLVEKNPLVRDQIKVGLEQFPNFEVTVGHGQAGVNMMRGRRFGCVFLGVDPRQKDTVKLLHNLRGIDPHTELFVMTPSRSVKDMQADKSKFNIHSFLQTPLDLKEFFGLVGRFLERAADREKKASAQRGQRTHA